MQVKISKTLAGIIARAAFHTAKSGLTQAFQEFLILEFLSEERSLAYRLLSLRLRDWELDQIRQRIEYELSGLASAGPADDPDALCGNFERALYSMAARVGSLSTAEALHTILLDRSSVAARIMEMYGISAETVAELIRQFSFGQPRPEERSATPEHTQPTPGNTAPRLLERFGTDLTRRAREGGIDPVVGRDREIGRLVEILTRRKKNNPILVGEAGVGKSAVVEGLALRIAAGEVPAALQGKRLFSLDLAALVAGTKFRGEFEERMQQLLDELRTTRDTILFIDEIHTIVGAGATQGGLDTANILKPALARGEVQVIGATTGDEYRASIEADAALERRFQRIPIEPTTPEDTLRILHDLAPRYERHHGVHYTDEALRACVALADRYLSDRQFPDKAVDLLDEAGARARLEATGCRTSAVQNSSTQEETARKSKADEPSADTAPRQVEITEGHVRQVITAMTGIPAERLSDGGIARLRGLGNHLARRIVGQEEAVDRITRTIRRAHAGLRDEHRPIGVFLFVGPTGVGKTLLAKEVSKWLFDERRGMIRIDMSEYGEKHNVARLIGAPPGYAGYGEGGQLTEAVRRQPYSVVLLDEIEKAHPEVFDTMLQIFDEGRLTDGSGRCVDFRHTIVVMTSNVGARAAAHAPRQVGYGTASKSQAVASAPEAAYRRALEETFAPEFLNRIDDIVVFRALEAADVERIVDLELQQLRQRTERLGYMLRITDSAKRRLAALGYERRYGVRALKRTLTDRVEEPLSSLIIDGGLRAGDTVVVESDRSDGIRLRVA